MEAREEYFARSDTPMEGSPVARLMIKLHGVCPNASWEELRVHAKALLAKAAGKKRYGFPRVFTKEQREAENRRFSELSKL